MEPTEDFSGAARRPLIKTLQLGEGWLPESVGGLTRYYHDLATHLPAQDVEVAGLVVGSAEVERSTHGTIKAFAAAAAPLGERLRAARKLTKQGAADRDRLVVSHFALYTFPSLDLVRSRPVVIHFHGPWHLEGRAEGERARTTWFKWAIEAAVYRQGSAFIVLSEAFKAELVRVFQVDPERVTVVPGGVDVERFGLSTSRSEARRRLGWPDDRPIVLTVRRLTHRMGLEHLIAAARLVAAEVPDVLVLIAGKGPLAAELQQRVSELGLEAHVKLLGYVADEGDRGLGMAYRAADFCVVPSIELEGFGLVVTEALASGTPTLVTPVGGLPEVGAGLAPGLVLGGTSPSAIADGMLAALKGTLPLPSPAACRAFAAERYGWSTVAAQVRQVYERALQC